MGCPPSGNLTSRPYAGGPQIQKVTIANNTGLAAYDLYSGKLTFPAKWIMFNNYADTTDTLPQRQTFYGGSGADVYLYFKPLGYPPGFSPSGASANLETLGTEPWIPMYQTAGPGGGLGTVIEFEDDSRCQEFYIAVGNPTAHGQLFTFIYSNGIRKFTSVPIGQ